MKLNFLYILHQKAVLREKCILYFRVTSVNTMDMRWKIVISFSSFGMVSSGTSLKPGACSKYFFKYWHFYRTSTK